jgi:hypothetical protein
MATTEKTERLLRWGDAYREMESDLCDVVNMGRIAAMLTCGDRPARSEDERTLTHFAVCQTERMLNRFKEKYDEDEWVVPGSKDDGEAS